MKLGSYNIWNHDTNYDTRMDLLINLIKEEKFDILVLQEVRDEDIVNKIVQKCNYKFSYWKKYFDCQEGMAIFSNHEILKTWTNWDENEDVHNSGLMFAQIKYNDACIGIMNVHLDYKYASNREIEILKATEYLKNIDSDYKFLLGDFNSPPNSSIYRYLTGNQSLNNCNTTWNDLGAVYCYRHNIKPTPTLDFVNNPRWMGKESLYIPETFDFILIEEAYPKDNPKLINYRVIGKDHIDGITPSDHYGVAVDVKF